MIKDFLKKITNNKIWLILLIIICVRGIVYSFYNEVAIYFDTTSYIHFEKNILKGEVDALRTPVYPNIIKFITLFGRSAEMYVNISILQEIVSLISVAVLYMTLRKEMKNQVLVNLATLLYGCLPSIFTYNRVILTESLSISLFVMYFCLIIKYLKAPSIKKAVAIGVFTLFLIMLRPSFLYLLVMLAIMFGLVFILKKENRKSAICGGIAVLGVIVSIFGYSIANKKQNGYFSISSVTQINQLDNIINLRIFDTGDPRDEGIIEIIGDWLDGYDGPWYRKTTEKIMTEYTVEEVDSYISRCIKNNFWQYIERTINKVIDLQLEPCDEIYLAAKGGQAVIKPLICFGVIFIYVIYNVIYILVKTIQNKKLSLIQATLLITILGQLAIIMLGAQAEFSRLFIPVFPIVIISLAWNIDDILRDFEIKEEQQLEGANKNERN